MSDEPEEEPQDAAAAEASDDAIAVQAQELAELAGEAGAGEGVGIGKLLDVPVRITVEIGRTKMSLGELVQLGPGALIELDRESHEPADILVNGRVVAQGEIVTIDRNYGVRITDVV